MVLRTALLIALAAHPQPANGGKLTLNGAAAATTVGINVLEAPATFHKTKAALKRAGRATKKAAKKVAGK